MKVAIAGYVGLSDITLIQKKHDVSGLFYENQESDNLKRLLINHA